MDRDGAKVMIAAALIQAKLADVKSNEGLAQLCEDADRIAEALLSKKTGGGSIAAQRI